MEPLGGGTGCGPLGWRNEADAGCWGGPGQCAPGGWAWGARGLAAVAGFTIGIDVVSGGRPAVPWWRPTSKVSAGPSGLPMLTRVPS